MLLLALVLFIVAVMPLIIGLLLQVACLLLHYSGPFWLKNTRKQEIFKIIYAIMTIHVPTNLAGTNNKAHTGTDK